MEGGGGGEWDNQSGQMARSSRSPRSKKTEEALAAGSKARAAFPKDEQTALVVARAQELLDRVTEAEQSYKAATQLDPNDLEAALGLARLDPRQRRPRMRAPRWPG